MPTLDKSAIYADGIVAKRERHPVGSSDAGLNQFLLVSITLAGMVQYGPSQGLHFVATAGDIIFSDPHIFHQWEIIPSQKDPPQAEWEVFYCAFTSKPEWSKWLLYPQIIPGYAKITVGDPFYHRRILRCMRTLLRLENWTSSYKRSLMSCALEEMLLWCRACHERQTSMLDPRVQTAIDYLLSHMNEPITLAKLSRTCHISRGRLSALFKEQVRQPPMQFLEERRLERAMELLSLTLWKISAIADELGYCDGKHFARRFKLFTGMTPREFRYQRTRSGGVGKIVRIRDAKVSSD